MEFSDILTNVYKNTFSTDFTILKLQHFTICSAASSLQWKKDIKRHHDIHDISDYCIWSFCSAVLWSVLCLNTATYQTQAFWFA